jgi:multidrug efflux pump subunit AcrB
MKGPIAWMARNTVAANLLMFAIFAGGTLGLLTIKQEVFPEFALDFVNVTVAYPGAGPAEVEQGIVLAVEEAVRGLDGVKRVTSVSAEGSGNISIELLLEADPDKVLAEIKNEIDRIRSFPEDAEKATVALAAPRSQVISLVISGDQELATLHAIAEEARTELLTSGEITQVELQGVRPLEVAIEVPRDTLRSYGLSLDQIAQQVRAASVELPGGGIDAEAGEFLVRVADRKELAAEFGGVTVRGTLAGASVSLSDIATVVNGYEDSDAESYFNGKRAVRVTAYRVGKETPNGVAAVVKAYAERLEASLPENVEVVTWNDSSEQLKGRIDLLVRNAFMGGTLVLIVLGFFLESRLAFWVALGIPISFMGSFLLMPHLDLSINMITLFGLIITLGMVVDDAIIVGENAYEKVQRGIPRMEAAVTGAQEMAVPVTFSILTTIAAFSPMFFVPGVMGKIFRLFPAVVIAVLAFSLLESFFILPAHLAHGKDRPPGPIRRVLDRVHHFGDHWLTRFTNELYRPVLLAALRNRFTVVVASASAFVLTIAALATGAQPFNFFPIIEGDIVLATARLPYGVPVHLTREIGDELVLAAEQAIEETGDARILRGIFTRVGESAPVRGPGPQRPEVGSHVVSVEMALVPSDQREASAEAVADAWRRAMPPVAGVQSLRFTASTGPGSGAAVDVQLSHADADVIAAASQELTEALRSYPALANINNGYASGKPQLDFEILPAAATLGLTASDIARQMRSSFYGAEVLREQRGRHEVKVMVRLPERQRQSEADLEDMLLRTPGGGDVPLSSVASFERGRAPTSIDRDSGKRVVNVTADLAAGVVSPRETLDSLKADVFPGLRDSFEGLTLEMAGAQREQGESLAALRNGYLMALIAIFALLAIPFRSYLQPLIVMVAIPFGLVGAVLGHSLMGYELSLISMFGIVALSGVVVNDSLVLIDTTNRIRAEGKDPYEAIVGGAMRRLRPILLTSLTTFFGLVPMIFETSVQARFLIPMAISLGFGILFATVVILLLVPVVYTLVEQLRSAWRGESQEEAAPQPVAA